MTVQSVTVTSGKRTYEFSSVEELRAARERGEIRLIPFKRALKEFEKLEKAQTEQPIQGAEIEHQEGEEKLTPEQADAKEAAKKQQEAEIAAAKAQAQQRYSDEERAQLAEDMIDGNATGASYVNPRVVKTVEDGDIDGYQKIREDYGKNEARDVFLTEEGRAGLAEQLEGLDELDEVRAQAPELKRRKAKKIEKAADKVLGRLDQFSAIHEGGKIFTDKKEYEAAVKQAKEDGTWDKDNPKYTLLDGKALKAAQELQKNAKEEIEHLQKSCEDLESKFLNGYMELEKLQENLDKVRNEGIALDGKTHEQTVAALETQIEKMQANQVKMYEQLRDNVLSLAMHAPQAQMFNEDGSVNTENYQAAMLGYVGGDYRGNISERRVLAKDADTKFRITDDMLKAAGLDAQKNYTALLAIGAGAAVLGAGALTAMLPGGPVVTAIANGLITTVTTIETNTTNTVTSIENTLIQNPDGTVVHHTGAPVTDVTTSTSSSTSTVTSPVQEVARNALSNAAKAASGLLGALPGAVVTAATVRHKDRDLFNGATARDVILGGHDLKRKDKAAQWVVDQIRANQDVDDETKVALVEQAIGGDEEHHSATLQELVAALAAVRAYAKGSNDRAKEIERINDELEAIPGITRTDDTEGSETRVEHDYNVKHKSGMGPWQYAEALGVPTKHIREFINMFREDNNLGTGGKYSKEPLLRMEYVFADGTKWMPGTKPEAQAKIDAYQVDLSGPNDHAKAVTSRDVRVTITRVPGTEGKWVYADGPDKGKEVPQSELETTYKARVDQWNADHGKS